MLSSDDLELYVKGILKLKNWYRISVQNWRKVRAFLRKKIR
jgi:hypothetical protein